MMPWEEYDERVDSSISFRETRDVCSRNKKKIETRIKRLLQSQKTRIPTVWRRAKESEDLVCVVLPSPSSSRTKDFLSTRRAAHKRSEVEVELRSAWMGSDKVEISSSNVLYPGFVNSIMQTQHEAMPILIGRWYLKPNDEAKSFAVDWFIEFQWTWKIFLFDASETTLR